MLRDRFLRRLFLVAAAFVVAAPGLLGQMAKISPQQLGNKLITMSSSVTGAQAPGPQLNALRQQHILYGDAHGGGHLHGMNKPCKSEFPEGWSESDIVTAIMQEAANDNLDWQQQRNGYYVADAKDKGITIRIVLNAKRDEVITAYPLDTPRNPCPAANDNED